MTDQPAIGEESVRIPVVASPAGRASSGTGRALEGRLAYPLDHQPVLCSLIAGPHPLLGGDLQNNVVQALLAGLADAGAVALAFNYAGVGRSEGGPADWPAIVSAFWRDGRFDEERLWVEDAAAALTFLRRSHDRCPVLIGYSFGCWTAVNNLHAADPAAVVLISPNPTQHTFDALGDFDGPLLVVHSNNDFSCAETDLVAWFETLRPPKSRVLIRAGEHFFRGEEREVVGTVLAFLRDNHLLEAPAA
ncbi:MAG: alpha/beta hydrolase [Phycisphaerae bacterium]